MVARNDVRFSKPVDRFGWIPRASVALAVAMAACPPAEGGILNWNNPAGGSASTAGNWNPAQIPIVIDDLFFNLNNAYTVTFNSSVTAADSHTYRLGTVTLNLTSPHSVASGLVVGDLSGDVSTLALTTGSLTSNNLVVIGDASGSAGTLNVNDDDADLILAGAATDLFVGNNGAGTLSITGGGNVVVPDQLIAGSNASSVSNLTVSGFVAQAPFPISRLDVTGTSQSRVGQGGDATMTVNNGALAEFGGDLVVANGSASTSTVTVQGQGLIAGARLNVAGDLLLGRNISGGTAAGVATLNVNADGNVDVGDTLFVSGDPDGGSATLHMADEGAIVTTSLDIGPGATLDLDGGTLDIEGGTLSYSNTASGLIIGGAQHPVVTMKSGATANLSTAVTGRSLSVGDGAGANLGDFDVRSGSDLTISGGGDVVIGDDADDDGSMIVNGTSSTMSLGALSNLIVGNSGIGRFEAELGGATNGDVMMIARFAGSEGLALFENPNTTAQFTKVYVGGSDTAAGGDGTLVVNQNAVLTMPGAGIPVRVWPTGLLDITSGQLNGSVQCDGEIQLQGTALMTGNLHLTGDLTGHPNFPGGPAVIDGSVLSATGTTISAIQGDLILGSEAETNGFSAALGNTVFTGANTVTLHDADEAVVASVVLDGGTLAAPNGIEIQNNGSIDGAGTIDGDVFYHSGGSVITATGAGGITIYGMLSNNSGNIDGTKFTFNGPNGGWTGAGAINARAVFNSGTQIDAIANMTIGLNVSDGVTFNPGSALHANDDTVTLVDSNGLGLGSLTDVDGGTIVCAQGLVVNNGRVLAGRGDVDTPLLTVLGRIAPGFEDGSPTFTGDLSINGNFALDVNSIVDCQFGGAGAGNFDRVLVSGNVSLNGGLKLRMLDGFGTAVGAQFAIIHGTSLTGEFDTLDLERPSPNLNWRVVYNTTLNQVRLVVTSCVADVTHDGVVDIDDLFAVIGAFNATGDNAADVSPPGGNDLVNIDDLFAVIGAWGLCP